MSVPTTRAYEKWQLKNSDDYLQLVDSTGTVISWIDSEGALQGNLASGGNAPGSTGQILFNNNGAIAADPDFTTDGAGNFTAASLTIQGAGLVSANLAPGTEGDIILLMADSVGGLGFISFKQADININARSGIVALNGSVVLANNESGTGPGKLGCFETNPVLQQTVTGVKSDPVAASILAALVAYGLVIDGTT